MENTESNTTKLLQPVGSIPPHKPHKVGACSLATSSSESIPRNLLTIFRAAPLVYLDKKGSPHSLDLPNFEYEETVLSDSLQEAENIAGIKIDLSFVTATVDRLGSFLASGVCHVLHLSCPGSKTYLMFDNGCGTAQPLLVDRLKEWIRRSKHKLQLVFLAAGHSRSAGEALVAAGVPHVICCQHNDVKLRETTAIEFARVFYRNLAYGRNIDEAFVEGRQEVISAANIKDAEKEIHKFALLPENGEHDVPLFVAQSILFDSSSTQNQELRKIHQSRLKNLPFPNQIFLGRNLEIWKVLDNLKTCRLVHIVGERGVGKRSLAAAVAQHIRNCLPNLVEDIIWLPYSPSKCDSRLDHLLSNLFAVCENNDISLEEFQEREDYEASAIKDILYEKKVLLIIDAKSMYGAEKLCTFLNYLFQETRSVRIIIVHRGDSIVRYYDFPVVEANVELGPLDITTSVRVFGKICLHRPKTNELRDIEKFLKTKNSSQDMYLVEPCSEVCKHLLSGNPLIIRRAAKSLTLEEYDGLIFEVRSSASIQTRVQLDEEVLQYNKQMNKATACQDTKSMRLIQEKLDRVNKLRETHPDIEALQMMIDDIKHDRDYALSLHDVDTAENIAERLEFLMNQLELESNALSSRGLKGPNLNLQWKKYLHHGTRSGLEVEIQKHQTSLEKATADGAIDDAYKLVGKMKYLVGRRSKCPSGDEIESELLRLERGRNDLIGRLNTKKLESFALRIAVLRKELAKERDAEKMSGKQGLPLVQPISNEGPSIDNDSKWHQDFNT
mmetsp:Transcript_14696/g.22958  ORF Transcript_14696/g.22958 Transcript_14696/m.22958 type:complete len:782 (+) Transcript_14696:69-2414(+)|eukprot:CAMPEP_0195291410 /NCGR_PEP_ID=MMETSP0707-20130614/7779_1 /TAXON_ID=33640 /ORGANISM="Asterionellopsis glacialis, Strain CCMP134" /LENGTH=781 /DNA_ID=CAMNT_0040351721 /DNA_START=40 /DNA_END=2385 /DNA_ORIENTATION=+